MVYKSTATTGMAMTSSPSSTYSLSCSSLGPVPPSSTFRYGFSTSSSTDLCLPGQQSPSLRASYLHPGTHPSSFLARKNAGLVALPSAHTPSACTASHPAHIPTPQGSHAPARRVDEDSDLVPLRLPPCYEPKLSLGSNALKDQPMQARAHLEDLPGSASRTHKPHSGGHAPSLLHSTQHGCAPAETDCCSRSSRCPGNVRLDCTATGESAASGIIYYYLSSWLSHVSPCTCFHILYLS